MRFYIIIVFTFYGLNTVQAQRQLDIQGTLPSIDTVATVKVNYSGKEDVIGLAVYSEPDSLFGIAGYFRGGFRGIFSESNIGTAVYGKCDNGTGLHGISVNSNGIYGKSSKDHGVHGQSDSTYGVYGNGPFAGVYGNSFAGHGLHGKSTYDNGVFGISENGVGVRGLGTSASHILLIPLKAGVYGSSDTVGVYGVAYDLKGRALKGLASGDNSIGVLGIAPSANSTGVWGDGSTGAFFRGSDGTSIQLGGADSPYSNPSNGDDCVIRSQKSQPNGDFILVTNDEMAIRLDDDDNSTSHFKVFNGDSVQIFSLDENGNLTITGTYDPPSDVNRKEAIIPVNGDSILHKINGLPISEWQFKGEDTRHLGPMAQDFYAAFGLGKRDTTISTIDADGVMMAAIQALTQNQMKHAQRFREIEQTNQILRSENTTLKHQIKKLLEIIESYQTID